MTKIFIALIAVLCIAVFFLLRTRTSLRQCLFAAGMVAAVFLFTVLADRFLGLAGFPAQVTPRVANPPNYRENRKSFEEYDYEFATNDQGLRYRYLDLEKESPRERRILVLGDSFVEGQGVEYDETFTALLESQFAAPDSPVRFINAGLRGTSQAEQMQLMFAVGFKYDLDAVILCVYPNDLAATTDHPDYKPAVAEQRRPDGPARILQSIYPHIYTLTATVIKGRGDRQYRAGKRDIVHDATLRAQTMGISQEAVDQWVASIPPELLDAANRFEFNGSALTSGLLSPDVWVESLDLGTPSAERKWHNMQQMLDFMSDACRSRNIQFGLVYIPAPWQYDPAFHNPSDPRIRVGVRVRPEWLHTTSNLQVKIAGWASQKETPWLDLTEDFRKWSAQSDESINYRLDSHWTPLGHRIAAHRIAQWIGNEDWVQPNPQN